MKTNNIKRIIGRFKPTFSDLNSNSKKIIADYLSDIRKRHILNNKIDPRDYEIIENVMPVITFVSQYDIESYKDDAEFNKIYSLLKKSKEKSKLDEELVRIYEDNRTYALNYLYIRRGKIIRGILGEQLKNYKALKRVDLRKSQIILDKCLSKATGRDKECLKLLNN
ncbi:MAG: hypothetical protein ACRC4V_06420 [Aeromonas veronii]